ncbi:hypothetical protein CRYUN_Cryun11dG0047300 [Craigia yunnanensis]
MLRTKNLAFHVSKNLQSVSKTQFSVFPPDYYSKSKQSESENEWERLLKPFVLDELRKSFNKITPYQVCKLLELPLDVPTSLKLFQWAGSQKGYCHTFHVYYVIIDKLGAAKEFKVIDRLLMQMKEGVVFKESLFILIMKNYGTAGLPGQATRLLLDVTSIYSCEPTLRSYNAVLSILVAGNCQKVMPNVFYDMLNEGISPNVSTFGLKLLEEMFLMGCTPDVQTFNDVFCGLCKLNHQVDEAGTLLNKVPSPNVVLFNTLINGYVASGQFDEADAVVYDIMLSIGCKPNVFTFNILIHGLCKKGCLGSALELVNKMEGKGCKPNVITYSMLIDGLEGRLVEVDNVLNEMSVKGVCLNTVEYNTLISTLCKDGKFNEAREMFGEMSSKGCKPDIFTFNSLISGLCKVSQMEVALGLYHNMLVEGVIANKITYNTLIHAFLRG